jgi:hypothetical protein
MASTWKRKVMRNATGLVTPRIVKLPTTAVGAPLIKPIRVPC